MKTLESHNSKLCLRHSPSPTLLQHIQQCPQGLMGDVVQLKYHLQETQHLFRPSMHVASKIKQTQGLCCQHHQSYHLQQWKEQLLHRRWFTPHTGGQLSHRLDSPLQEEKIGCVPLPYRLQGSKELAAQQRILGTQQGGLQQVEGGQVLHC